MHSQDWLTTKLAGQKITPAGGSEGDLSHVFLHGAVSKINVVGSHVTAYTK